MSARVLVVDDDPCVLRYMRTLLETEACNVQTANTGTEAIDRLRQEPSPDLAFLDMMMPGMDGMATLEALRSVAPQLPVVMVSCVRDIPKVVDAMRAGADYYLTKPVDGAAVDRVLKLFAQGKPDVAPAPMREEQVEAISEGAFFVAASAKMEKLRSRIGQIADVDVPVLMLGESGVGKEVAAMLIHKLSGRRNRTFMKVNCAAIPADLLESELFGYEPGAFTGATQSKPGKFELCDRGTILLDEIGEMPPALQAKLLQVLQDQQFFRLGSRTPIKVDVRILAATNINVQEAIKSGKLRLDLYYRLNSFVLEVPPLRERREAIPVLSRVFLEKLSARYKRTPKPLSGKFMEACMRYSWPGNVRELQNVIKRYVVLGDEAGIIEELKAADPNPAPSLPAVRGAAQDLKQMVRLLKGDAEAQVIREALTRSEGSRHEAARALGISYKALVYKARQYGIIPERLGVAPAPAA